MRGFTLPEVLLVAVLLAVMLLLAMPSYQQHVLQAHRAIAVAELSELSVRLDGFFQDHRRYAGGLDDLGMPSDPYAIDAQGQPLAVSDPRRIYRLELRLEGNGFRISAHPQLAQTADTECAVLSLTDYGLRSVSGSAPVSQCW
ncbi:MAG: hypothetical protein Hals2KO_29990 [Halioglobus sp.]